MKMRNKKHLVRKQQGRLLSQTERDHFAFLAERVQDWLASTHKDFARILKEHQ